MKYQYDPADRTHSQIDPEAFAIVQRGGFPIEPGKRDDKSPKFRGMPENWWAQLLSQRPKDFTRLVEICQEDFPTYCALLLRIVSRTTAENHTFIWNNGQQILWNRMAARRAKGEPLFFVVLKARQLGITTFVAAWHHFNLWKGKDVRALNVAHDVSLAERIVTFYRIFHDGLPDVGGIKPRLRADSKSARIPKSELYYADNRSHGATHVAKNLDPRGNTSRFIGESEAAFYPELHQFNDALFPQLPTPGTAARANCSVIIESTPNGQNEFYESWEAAKEENTEFDAVFLPWYVQDDEYVMTPPSTWRMDDEEKEIQARLSAMRRQIDGRGVTREQMYWREYVLENQHGGDLDGFDTEYPSDDETCFLLRSHSVFQDDMRYLQECVQAADVRASEKWIERLNGAGEPIRTNSAIFGNLTFPALHNPFENVFARKFNRPKFVIGQGDLQVWEPPERDQVYFWASDTAGGDGGGEHRDASTAFVGSITTGRQVAEFSSRDISPEAFADFLVHLALWYNKMMGIPEVNGLGSVVLKRMTNDWGYANLAHEEKWDEVGVKKDKPGFYTSPRNRALIFSALRWFISERYLAISSRELMKQMSQFKVEGMEYRTAKKNQHDDLVVSAGLFCIGVRQSPKMLMAMTDARKNRVPNAVDLGLNHGAPPEIRIKGATDEILAEVMGRSAWDHACVNPLRGWNDWVA